MATREFVTILLNEEFVVEGDDPTIDIEAVEKAFILDLINDPHQKYEVYKKESDGTFTIEYPYYGGDVLCKTILIDLDLVYIKEIFKV